MKKLILFLSSFLLLGIFSFAQGVQFKKYSWSDAIEQATKENKIIFVDANTSWCAPCKKEMVHLDEFEKKYFKSINNLDSKLDLKKNSLRKLDSDTDNIIEYIDEKENKEKKLSFWDLIKNED